MRGDSGQVRRKRQGWAGVIAALCGVMLAVSARAEVRLAQSDEVLQAALAAAARSLAMPEDATPGDTVAAARGDYARLVAVLYADGYYGPSVSITLGGREASGLSTLTPPGQVTPVVISVDQGPPFRFGQARVGPLPEGAVLPEEFQTGRTARSERIRAAAQIGLEAWRTASHAKADITRTDIVARHGAGQVDVDITIEPGPALRFGRLIVPENGSVRPERLRKITGLPVGEPYHPDEVRRSRARLVDTGAFNTVVLREAETPNPDGTLDYTLRVEDAPQRRLGFGAEVSSDEGLSVEAFWLHRNIFGGAERLRLSLDIDGIDGGGASDGVDYELGAVITVPGFRRPDDTLTIGTRLQRLDEPTYLSDVFEIGVNRARKFDDRRSAALGIGYRAAETDDAFGARTFRHFIFTAEATYDGRDDTVAPRAGEYVGFEASPFLGVSGSASGFRMTGDLRGYRALGASTVVAARLQLGTVLGSGLDDTPPEFLFLSGGGGTVRGQDFQSLGVDLPAGRVGGRSFVGLSGEIRQSLGGNFGVVGFVDYGYVANGSDFAAGDDHAGIGIGARYATGLGALRVDLATQATGDTASGVFLYIGLGEAF